MSLWSRLIDRQGHQINIGANGALDVAIQDQHTELIDLYMVRVLDTLTVLAGVAIDGASINVETTGVVPAAGNLLCLKEGTSFYQSQILTVTPIAGNQYTLAMDTPFDFAFTVAGGCSLTDNDLSVNGSVTPVIFQISPSNLAAGTEWDIVRMIVYIQGTTAMDDGLFGDQVALTKGIVFRSHNGIIKNIFNAKDNGHFAQHCYDRDYTTKAPAGKTSVAIRRGFGGQEKNGVVIRLKADSADAFQCIVQDDLSLVDQMHVIVQGHIVDKS